MKFACQRRLFRWHRRGTGAQSHQTRLPVPALPPAPAPRRRVGRRHRRGHRSACSGSRRSPCWTIPQSSTSVNRWSVRTSGEASRPVPVIGVRRGAARRPREAPPQSVTDRRPTERRPGRAASSVPRRALPGFRSGRGERLAELPPSRRRRQVRPAPVQSMRSRTSTGRDDGAAAARERQGPGRVSRDRCSASKTSVAASGSAGSSTARN